MAKACDNTVLDGMLNVIKTATRQVVCSGQPANFAGIAAVNLAQVTMVPANDYTITAGDVSGRKITTATKNALPITTSGAATHVALDNGTTLLYVTTCASQTLNVGNTVNVPGWKVEVQGPT
jgi:hypothetical protein